MIRLGSEKNVIITWCVHNSSINDGREKLILCVKSWRDKEEIVGQYRRNNLSMITAKNSYIFTVWKCSIEGVLRGKIDLLKKKLDIRNVCSKKSLGVLGTLVEMLCSSWCSTFNVSGWGILRGSERDAVLYPTLPDFVLRHGSPGIRPFTCIPPSSCFQGKPQVQGYREHWHACAWFGCGWTL